MRSTSRTLTLTAAVAATALALPGPAHAGGPGDWSRVTPTSHQLKNITEIAVDREQGGGLHISWQFGKSVFYDRLEPDLETLGGLRTVATYSNGINGELDIEAIGPAIYSYYAGLEPNASYDNVMAMSQSTDGGTTWTPPAPISSTSAGGRSPVYASNGLAAMHGLDGTVYSIWGSAGSAFHVGSNPADPDTGLPGDRAPTPASGSTPRRGR